MQALDAFAEVRQAELDQDAEDIARGQQDREARYSTNPLESPL